MKKAFALFLIDVSTFDLQFVLLFFFVNVNMLESGLRSMCFFLKWDHSHLSSICLGGPGWFRAPSIALGRMLGSRPALLKCAYEAHGGNIIALEFAPPFSSKYGGRSNYLLLFLTSLYRQPSIFCLRISSAYFSTTDHTRGLRAAKCR